MATAIIQFSIAATVIVIAGVALTWCTDTIAERTKLGRLFVGSIFLAAATSLPELTTDLNAIWLDLPDMAVGGLVGSSLFNLLILAIADLAHRTRGSLLSRISAAHALAGAVTIALTALVGLSIVYEHTGTGFVLAGMGPGVVAVFVAYSFGIRLIFYDQRASVPVDSPSSVERARERRMTLRLALVGYLLGAIVVLLTAPFLAGSAGRLADLTGLGGTFVGTTLVALSTSLPELVATTAALRMKAYDLAIGNIFGSNAFNMLLLVPLDLAFPGSLLSAVSLTHVLTCFAVILVTAVVVLGQLYRVERRTFFIEPDAALVIVLVIGSLAMIYAAR